jgi:hypothetical protein
MSTISHGSHAEMPERSGWTVRVAVPEMWASLAITAMWVAVFCCAIWGPDFVSTTSTSMTKIPSAIFVAVFAYLGTVVVARYGFGKGRDAKKKD